MFIMFVMFAMICTFLTAFSGLFERVGGLAIARLSAIARLTRIERGGQRAYGASTDMIAQQPVARE